MSRRHRHRTTSTRRSIRTPSNTDPQLLELLRSHYTLPEAAQALDMAYSTTYRLIVQQKRLPCIVWERGSRGPYTPSYLVPRREVALFKRRGRRDRRKAGRKKRYEPRGPVLELGRSLVKYRKEHGRYPLPGESIEGAPAQSERTIEGEKPTA